MNKVSIAALAMTAILSNGCGTICNLKSDDPEVYGGIRKDVEYMRTPPDSGNNQASGSGGDATGILVILMAEVGLSLVADTLTLPLVVRKRHKEHASESEANPAGAEKEPSSRRSPIRTPSP
jgi:uncharacterized protein YceK